MLKPPPPTELQTADRVYRELQLGILSGELQPRERLVERDLVTRFSVSRTPIREALTRLRDIGLVVSAGKRGVEVAAFTAEDVINIYFVREILEKAAAELIVKNISQEEIDEASQINDDFKLACDNANIADMILYNNNFHEALLRSTRNPIMSETLVNIRIKTFLFRYSLWMNRSSISISYEQHKDMLNALRSSSTEEYRRLVVDHMNVAKDAYLARSSRWFK